MEIFVSACFRRQAEQEARRKALIAGMKDKKKRFEVRAYENDGWCKMLQIWRPKATVDVAFIKEKNVKSKWFRDPNTDQDCFITLRRIPGTTKPADDYMGRRRPL